MIWNKLCSHFPVAPLLMSGAKLEIAEMKAPTETTLPSNSFRTLEISMTKESARCAPEYAPDREAMLDPQHPADGQKRTRRPKKARRPPSTAENPLPGRTPTPAFLAALDAVRLMGSETGKPLQPRDAAARRAKKRSPSAARGKNSAGFTPSSSFETALRAIGNIQGGEIGGADGINPTRRATGRKTGRTPG